MTINKTDKARLESRKVFYWHKIIRATGTVQKIIPHSKVTTFPVEILAIYLSGDHDFVGHHGKPRGKNPVLIPPEAECVAGQGLRGDRYFGFKENYKGQVTFFDQAVHDTVQIEFGITAEPYLYRRNILISGIDLNQLIGQSFAIDGIRFSGVQECSPCYWMDEAVAPGTEKFLEGRGGLRARILRGGILKTGRRKLEVLDKAT